MDIVITNNPIVAEQFQGKFNVDYSEVDILELLINVRDLIHKGHRLLSHPLSGSVKPNETCYKSVVITEQMEKVDFQSVGIIEDCIASVEKFPKKTFPKEYEKDMQIVDLSLIRSALDK